ncbi:MAG: hypothetical protein M5T61_21610 [Acidimicrobiia bacterium]|nr:hypothetical protein [Acidimicrobiia bacterium]
MSGNAKARQFLEEILTGVRFGVQFASKATDGKHDYWEGSRRRCGRSKTTRPG